MAKLLPITKVVNEMIDNVRCDHCDAYIHDTEIINQRGYIFWCNECVETDFKILYEVLKSIDKTFQFLPNTFYDPIREIEKKRRYYWWASGEYITKIKAISKADRQSAKPTHIGAMIRESTDGRYQWHAPKENGDVIKPHAIVFLNEPYTFNVKWSDGTTDTFVDGVRQQ